MGRIKEQLNFDWAGADASIRRAVELEPGNPEVVRFAASLAAFLGRTEEALRLSRQALDLDPLNAESWERPREVEYLAGRLDEAEAHSKKALELNPDVWPGPFLLSEIYLMQERPQDALLEIKLIRYDPQRTFLYAIAYQALGRKKDSDAALSELIAQPQNADEIAEVYAFRNQSDAAFEWLDRAFDQRNPGLIVTKVDPFPKSLYNDPRFAALLKKLNFPT